MTYIPAKIVHRQERNVSLARIETKQHVKIPKAKEVSLPYGIAFEIAYDVSSKVHSKFPEVQIQIAGSLRRLKQTVHDIDILLSPPHEESHAFIRTLGDILIDGPTKTSILYHWTIGVFDGHTIQVDFRYIKPGSWGPALQYFTGSAEHNISLRRMAKEQGWSLSEHGLFDSSGSRLDDNTENGVYKALGLRWLPPEYRNDFIKHRPYVPKPTWCIDHMEFDFCKRNRMIAKETKP